MFLIIPRSRVGPLLAEMGSAPEFFLMPIRWWRGEGFSPSGTTRVFDVWVSPEKKVSESPYVFSTLTRVVSPNAPASSLFDSPTFGIQPVASSRWRLLARSTEISRIRAVLATLKKQKGLRFRDEETGAYLDDEDPNGVYASGISPFWRAADICTTLGLPGPSTKCTQVQFSLGDLRTTSWLLQGEGVDRLAGSIHRLQFDTITVVSSEAFKRLKAAALGSRVSNADRQPPP